ncbi:MAG: M16 family peptidase [Candidatus Daviesbacteria bacterium GW2011_GWA1_41_61]|uniref:M16 family peptidase n=1 Tax=Candidatus Daviesbacteria bacterium GW2011_GWA2_40_9 TaxID=1618424 RepID=A0A0G0WG19_9BACT|nr:MAG: zinc protease [Candidatus Daviesbacteria bacterium GW2011_GWC1_40_9]KKR83235.1 MAG: M16 family peptidase [Candidatus Daviesbacteria bacterium GW2011_GWA2_40_9]KKR93580.1 MAG: M16 family peptidase [Candidatus Daviesbacteria bacterium GW2011_GWB1_41_15]KKS14869.1 MAG: M16 family peptidase [Candidatus Daviesbacteria bacterium GW2011_GWA1_41_61]
MLLTYKLKNGLNVATYSIPEMRSVFLWMAVKGGSIFDTKDTAGIAHFGEHLLVQGIPTLPNVEDFSNFLESLAASYSAATSPQYIRFSINAPAAHLSKITRIASEVFFSPLFPQDAIERERRVIVEEIKEKQDTLEYKIYQFFAQNRFTANHPMQLETAGDEKVIKKLTREDLVKWWTTYFYPENTYLVLVGGFKNDQGRQLIEEFFAKYPALEKKLEFPKFTNQYLKDRYVAIREDRKLKTTYLDLTFPSIDESQPLEERICRALVKNILGGLRGSRLYRLLRQRRGLVYSVGAGSIAYQRFGYAYISSQVAAEKLEEVIRLIAKELAVFYKTGPTQEELDFAKNHHTNRALMHWDHPSAIADWIAGDLMWEDKIYIPEEYVDLVERINLKDIREFIKKYWDFSKLGLTIQGPVENSKENRKKFENLVAEIK